MDYHLMNLKYLFGVSVNMFCALASEIPVCISFYRIILEIHWWVSNRFLVLTTCLINRSGMNKFDKEFLQIFVVYSRVLA